MCKGLIHSQLAVSSSTAGAVAYDHDTQASAQRVHITVWLKNNTDVLPAHDNLELSFL